MEPQHLGLLRSPTSLSLHPDGRRIAVAVQRIDLEKDTYLSEIWLLGADETARRFTQGDRDSAPRWSPDGRWLAFLRASDEDEPPQLHVMPADGGEARRLTGHPLGGSELVWDPSSRWLAYVARLPEAGRYERGPDARKAGHEAPRRITSLRYRLDNLGFLTDRPAHVFVVDAVDPTAEPRQVSREDLEFHSPTWTPDGAHLVCTANWVEPELSLAEDLYAIPVTGDGPARAITAGNVQSASPVVSADGRTVYFLGTDQLDLAGRTVGLFSIPFDGSAPPRRLTDAEEWDLHDSHHDAPLRLGPEGLVALAATRGSVHVVRIPLDRQARPEPIGPAEHMVTDVALAGGAMAAVIRTATSPGEVAVLEGSQWRQLSDFGRELRESSPPIPMSELTATAPDGYPVHGWLVRPPGPGPHPVLLVIHGGPFTQFGHVFFDEAQVYASAGYAVVLGNPRGSSGYGEEHGRAVVAAMDGPAQGDLLALLDAAIGAGGLDGERVGVMGGSYGGFMTTWLAAHAGDRFRAAISERALNAWDSFTGSSDIGWFFTSVYLGKEDVAAASPLSYAERIEIPMLIIHSEQDWRCPVEQAQRLFVDLKLRDRQVELLLFPGEGHELSRSGLPSHRLARFEAVLDWWNRHLREAPPG